MATYLSGNVRRATDNTLKAMRRSAEHRQCPLCGRKSAVKFYSDDYQVGHYCRWKLEGKCTYDEVHARD